jgi:hypothetical protein
VATPPKNSLLCEIGENAKFGSAYKQFSLVVSETCPTTRDSDIASCKIHPNQNPHLCVCVWLCADSFQKMRRTFTRKEKKVRWLPGQGNICSWLGSG